jgi:gamma-glutamyl hercynylcysteine S-oxide hydrolase
VCRHLAYLGSPVALHDLTFGAAHSLADQARDPTMQEWGDTNPDGWGIGWYVEGHEAPSLHLTTTPMWDDLAFAEPTCDLRAHSFIAAARLASPGSIIATSGNAPFREGRWLFSLNGIVHGFHEEVGHMLREQLSDARRARLQGDADTEVLFALVLDRIDAGASPTSALRTLTTDVCALTSAHMNFLLADGDRVFATRSGRSLFLRCDTGVTIVSEPLDNDSGWHPVPDESVIAGHLGPDGPVITVEDLL